MGTNPIWLVSLNKSLGHTERYELWPEGRPCEEVVRGWLSQVEEDWKDPTDTLTLDFQLPELGEYKKIIFNWRIITLQYCAGFCNTAHWISHRFIYVAPSWTSLPSPSPSLPSRLSQSTRLELSASYSKFLLAIYFTYGNVYVSMLFSHQFLCVPPISVLWATQSVFCYDSLSRLIYSHRSKAADEGMFASSTSGNNVTHPPKWQKQVKLPPLDLFQYPILTDIMVLLIWHLIIVLICTWLLMRLDISCLLAIYAFYFFVNALYICIAHFYVGLTLPTIVKCSVLLISLVYIFNF